MMVYIKTQSFSEKAKSGTLRKTPDKKSQEKDNIPMTIDKENPNTDTVWKTVNRIRNNKNKSNVIYGSTNNNPNTDTVWKTVNRIRNNKNKSNVIYGSTNNTTIKRITAYADYHVCKLEPEVTEPQVINYLKEKNVIGAKCERMESRRPKEYASFKVSVPLPYKEEIRKTETWPTNVQVNSFLYRLQKPPQKK
ncbi:hypothetical protein QE152_g26138 [Popillia japonica]|uniref:Uncharacterized protein n=1 Tax=Popillia japonica TaxID=7064 RepID=A0AAW1JYN2_POPJA